MDSITKKFLTRPPRQTHQHTKSDAPSTPHCIQSIQMSHHMLKNR